MTPERRAVAARVHLHAVFRTLEVLSAFRPLPKWAGRAWVFGISSPGAGTAVFEVRDGRARYSEGSEGVTTAVQLGFSLKHAIPRLASGRFVVPQVERGWTRPLRVLSVFRALQTLEAVLQRDASRLPSQDLREAQVPVLLGAAIHAAGVIAAEDPVARRIHAECGRGTIVFRVGEEGVRAAVQIDKCGVALVASEEDPGEGDVTIVLRDDDAARTVLQNRIDSHSAAGLGLVRVRGRVPLADAFGMILDRIHHYVARPRRST